MVEVVPQTVRAGPQTGQKSDLYGPAEGFRLPSGVGTQRNPAVPSANQVPSSVETIIRGILCSRSALLLLLTFRSSPIYYKDQTIRCHRHRAEKTR